MTIKDLCTTQSATRLLQQYPPDSEVRIIHTNAVKEELVEVDGEKFVILPDGGITFEVEKYKYDEEREEE